MCPPQEICSIINDARLDDMLDNVYDQMTAGNYLSSRPGLLGECSQLCRSGVPGGHYHVDRETGKITYYKVLTPLEIGISLLVAAVIEYCFFIIVKSRYQLKWVDTNTLTKKNPASN